MSIRSGQAKCAFKRAQAVAEGGTVQTIDAGIRIQNANRATIYLSIGTNSTYYHDMSGNAATLQPT
jgi:alpha-L-fucosidase 2